MGETVGDGSSPSGRCSRESIFHEAFGGAVHGVSTSTPGLTGTMAKEPRLSSWSPFAVAPEVLNDYSPLSLVSETAV